MKKKQYYKILPNQLYKTNNQDIIIKHLVENNICEKFTTHQYSGNFEKTDVLGEFYSKSRRTKIYDSLIYSNEVINEFYSFLLTHYRAGLGQHIIFNLKLHQEIFGLSYTKSKKIALSYFEVYYNQIPVNPSFKLKFDEIRNIIPATKFESLKRYKDCLFLNLENKSELIIPYLAGEDNYYNRDLFENNSMIKEIFEFENNLKILIELNNKYQFEKDDIFTPKPKAELIYEDYSDDFHSIEQIQFIEKQFLNEKNRNYSFVVSLFYFFINEIQIKMPSADLFNEIISTNFNFTFSKIKLNDPSNLNHKKRVNKLKKEWLNP
tara:strand:- start:542 stop:1504 length:963 start_codon:yes stop_codon:yes gene_type:complete